MSNQNATYNVDAIKEMVQKDHKISQQLLLLLQSETSSLQQHNYDQVKDILTSKTQLLNQLNQHAEIRKKWLLSLYKVADSRNWREFLSSLDTPNIDQQWDEVQETIETCQTINNSNGLLIARGQRTYAQLLRLLKGGSQQTELYTAKGNKQSSQAQFCVSKA